MENYEVQGVVGEGTYGVVHKAKHRASGMLVAIKQFKEVDAHELIRKTAQREIKILKQLVHDNIVALFDVFREKGRLFLVFEYIERSLLSDLEICPNGLDRSFVRPLLYQLLQALGFIHSHNIIHRDVKPENILLTHYGVVKLCDFGFARAMSVLPGTKYTDYVATRWYRAPELLVGQTDYGSAVDLWAVGCLLCELLTGVPLFPGESDIDQLHHIINCFGPQPAHLVEIFYRNPLYRGAKLPVPARQESIQQRFPFLSSHALSLIMACLRYDPAERPSAAKLLAHPFFSASFVEHFQTNYAHVIKKEREQRNKCLSACNNSILGNVDSVNQTLNNYIQSITTDKAGFERSLPSGPTVVSEGLLSPQKQMTSSELFSNTNVINPGVGSLENMVHLNKKNPLSRTATMKAQQQPHIPLPSINHNHHHNAQPNSMSNIPQQLPSSSDAEPLEPSSSQPKGEKKKKREAQPNATIESHDLQDMQKNMHLSSSSTKSMNTHRD